jgi:hypothetical protein
MTPPAGPERDKYHRVPGGIISPAVWLYYRFPLTTATCKSSFSSAVSPCPTKPFVNGASSLGRRRPINGVVAGPDLATPGIWMRGF